ncbi:hypothetical protein BpHYR1_038662 [Brachionus plicatilis]|uniref:RNA-directed DNA polymerase from mobile element jockey-like n=1 Tax=Brachionus plicatilis TaxID=10195 RepID=A0A3M7RC63_BRAPC|nr:hypothetical protein BpHYR1_038662 [Brachionus plicatilis]
MRLGYCHSNSIENTTNVLISAKRSVTQWSVQDLYTDFVKTFCEAAKLLVKKCQIRAKNLKPPWWNTEIASFLR